MCPARTVMSYYFFCGNSVLGFNRKDDIAQAQHEYNTNMALAWAEYVYAMKLYNEKVESK